MGWLLVEALAALALLIFIVWWTTTPARGRRSSRPHDDGEVPPRE